MFLGSLKSYDLSFIVNISVPMAQYGNAPSLDYYFSYGAMWAAEKTPPGLPLTSRLTVGDNPFSDDFVADNFTAFHFLRRWGGSTFEHTGTTSVLTYPADPSTGYIPITIGLTFPFTNLYYTEYYMRNATFKITTPLYEAPPPPPSSNSSSTTSQLAESTAGPVEGGQEEGGEATLPPGLSLPSSPESTPLPSGSVTLPTLLALSNSTSDASVFTSQSTDSAGNVSPVIITASSSGSSSPTPIETKNLKPGAIAGATLGSIAFIALLALILVFCLRRRKKRVERERERTWAHRSTDLEKDRSLMFPETETTPRYLHFDSKRATATISSPSTGPVDSPDQPQPSAGVDVNPFQDPPAAAAGATTTEGEAQASAATGGGRQRLRIDTEVANNVAVGARGAARAGPSRPRNANAARGRAHTPPPAYSYTGGGGGGSRPGPGLGPPPRARDNLGDKGGPPEQTSGQPLLLSSTNAEPNVQSVESSVLQLALVEPTPPSRPEMNVASTSGKKGSAISQGRF
ncbi:hypothetical protein FRC17_010922 [Serendipita sp. 399]|nr:hypothetical protein FRC17_010922 [Serendipita sp. 399]